MLTFDTPNKFVYRLNQRTETLKAELKRERRLVKQVTKGIFGVKGIFSVKPIKSKHSESRKEEYKQYLKSEHWKETRKQRMVLDNFKCCYCGVTKNLNVHHFTYDNLWVEKMEDLITLCKPCHSEVHRKKKRNPRIKSKKQKQRNRKRKQEQEFKQSKDFFPRYNNLIKGIEDKKERERKRQVEREIIKHFIKQSEEYANYSFCK